ncbi:hypothetical protein X777_15942, partial [Ooceraea biroi]
SLAPRITHRVYAGETICQIRCVIVIINGPDYHREARFKEMEAKMKEKKLKKQQEEKEKEKDKDKEKHKEKSKSQKADTKENEE